MHVRIQKAHTKMYDSVMLQENNTDCMYIYVGRGLYVTHYLRMRLYMLSHDLKRFQELLTGLLLPELPAECFRWVSDDTETITDRKLFRTGCKPTQTRTLVIS